MSRFVATTSPSKDGSFFELLLDVNVTLFPLTLGASVNMVLAPTLAAGGGDGNGEELADDYDYVMYVKQASFSANSRGSLQLGFTRDCPVHFSNISQTYADMCVRWWLYMILHGRHGKVYKCELCPQDQLYVHDECITA